MFIESMQVNQAQVRKAYSPYSKFYDSSCYNWEPDSESNLYFLNKAQRELNNQLKEDGYLFLNDVYKRLGIMTKIIYSETILLTSVFMIMMTNVA